tara:strand:+ start:16148 stop:17224 length:1077 start_codon:yes stop_codon:yes gene_type:complete
LNKVKIIAEAGVNHNGDIELAKELVDVAYDSGADVVKFQTFTAKELATPQAKQAPYQSKNTKLNESQYEMLKRLELNRESHFILKEKCDKLGIDFLSTAFDVGSLKFLIEKLKFQTLKIPSGEITNAALILEGAFSGCDLIVSTGMATLEEIEAALGVAAFGYISEKGTTPSSSGFSKAYNSEKGKKLLQDRVSLLHCTTDYPANPKDINLKAMDTMRDQFGLSIGYSDHSLGVDISVAAVAKGAHIIEKHFTLDRNLPGPDHLASLEPKELKGLVQSIRKIELSLGDGIKAPKESELENKKVARKGIFASKRINKGDTITEDMLSIKRPEKGLSPMLIWDVIGSKADRNYDEDEAIE